MPGPDVPLYEIEIRFVRSSGAGGQNVNKVNTKAVLRWPVVASRALPADVRRRFLERFARRVTVAGEIVLSGDRYRDQGRNVTDCIERLRAMIEEASVVPKSRRPTKPGRAARERRIAGKKARSATKRLRSAPARDD